MGGKAFALSAFLPTGTQTVARFASISRSTIGKMAINMIKNTTSEVMKNVISGKYNNDKGDFSFDLLLADYDNVLMSSAISTLTEFGFGNRADELFKDLAKSNKILSEKSKKFIQKVANGDNASRLAKYSKTVDKQARETAKLAKKAIIAKAEDETTKKVFDEGQKKIRSEE